MKICHIVPSFGLGGMEKVLCTMLNATMHEYEHTLLALDNRHEASKWIQEPQLRLLEFIRPPGRRRFFQALYNTLRAAQPDLLMTYNWGATDAIWLGRLAGIRRIIHSEHGFNVDEAAALLWKRDLIRFAVYRLATKTVVVSHELTDILQHKFYLNERKIAFIPNGINAQFYAQDHAEREKIRTALHYTSSDFVLGFSGRLDPVKNFDLMINIFACCAQKDVTSKLLFIGDGPEKKRIAQLCREQHLQDRVLFVGQQEEVLPYLRALDVFILTSYREQMPMTVLEAMAVGIPVVASQVGELPYVIDEGVDGFLMSPQADPETWAEVVLSLKNEAQYIRIGLAARQKILHAFQAEQMVSSYRHLIENVLGATKP